MRNGTNPKVGKINLRLCNFAYCSYLHRPSIIAATGATFGSKFQLLTLITPAQAQTDLSAASLTSALNFSTLIINIIPCIHKADLIYLTILLTNSYTPR